MTRWLTALVIVIAGAQQPHGPEPPPGWFCSRDGIDAHACECQRRIIDEDCEGEPIEEPRCKSWCWKQHCHCPVTCVAPQIVSPEEDADTGGR